MLEIAELLTLALNNTDRNVVSFKIPTKISPSNHSTSSGILVLLEPISCLILELKRSELDVVLKPDIAAFKMLVDIHEPIVGVCGLGTVAERLRLICKELVEGRKLRLMIELPLTLIPLVALALVALLHQLNQQLSVGVCGCHQSLPCIRRRR